MCCDSEIYLSLAPEKISVNSIIGSKTSAKLTVIQ